MTYRNALSHDTGLLHSSRPSELLHVPAEVAFPTLIPEACFTLAAAGPPAPGARRAPAGRHLNGGCGRPHLGLRPVGHPLLKTRSEKSAAGFYLQVKKNWFPCLWVTCCSFCISSRTFPTSYSCSLMWNKLESSWSIFNKWTISIRHGTSLSSLFPVAMAALPVWK